MLSGFRNQATRPAVGCLGAVNSPRFSPHLCLELFRPEVGRHKPHVCHVARHKHDNSDVHEPKLGPNVLSGVNELKDHVKWSPATVMRNEAVNLDGSVRLLHLSVADHVDVLYGRRVKGVTDDVRWIDSYTVPGQCVEVRLQQQDMLKESGKTLFTVASTPYESRRDSSYLDASLIEIVADRNGSEDEIRLAELGPGALVEVSQVIGRGFSSLLNSYVGIPSALEEGRNLVLVAAGTHGMAAARATLSWTPVLAHATAHRVFCCYVTGSPSQAAFITEWDAWREAGVQFQPLYTEGCGQTGSSYQDVLVETLDQALFKGAGGFEGIAGKPTECCVLLAGLPREVASKLAKQLMGLGVTSEQLLFCEYF